MDPPPRSGEQIQERGGIAAGANVRMQYCSQRTNPEKRTGILKDFAIGEWSIFLKRGLELRPISPRGLSEKNDPVRPNESPLHVPWLIDFGLILSKVFVDELSCKSPVSLNDRISAIASFRYSSKHRMIIRLDGSDNYRAVITHG